MLNRQIWRGIEKLCVAKAWTMGKTNRMAGLVAMEMFEGSGFWWVNWRLGKLLADGNQKVRNVPAKC